MSTCKMRIHLPWCMLYLNRGGGGGICLMATSLLNYLRVPLEDALAHPYTHTRTPSLSFTQSVYPFCWCSCLICSVQNKPASRGKTRTHAGAHKIISSIKSPLQKHSAVAERCVRLHTVRIIYGIYFMHRLDAQHIFCWSETSRWAHTRRTYTYTVAHTVYDSSDLIDLLALDTRSFNQLKFIR